MTSPHFIYGLGQNIALIFAVTFVYGLVSPKLNEKPESQHQILKGVIFGVFSILAMLATIHVENGFIIDGRYAVITIAGLFGGKITVIVAGLIACCFRLLFGGAGMLPAISSIVTIAIVTSMLHTRFMLLRPSRKLWALLIVGTVLTLQIFLWLIVWNQAAAIPILERTVFPMLLVFPPATVLLGGLLIYQQQQAEVYNSLAVSEARYAALFNGNLLALYQSSPEGLILKCNQTAARLLGFPDTESLMRVSAFDFYVNREDRARWQTIMQRDDVVKGFEVQLRRRSGELFWASHSSRCVRAKDGSILYFEGSIEDISHRKQLEAQELALKVEKSRTEWLRHFIADISHDFRTPLSIISNSIYLMNKTDDPQRQQEHMEKLQDQVERVITLLDNMVEVVALEQEMISFQSPSLSINQELQRMVGAFDSVAIHKRLVLEFYPSAEDILVSIDQAKFSRALTCIIENALQYTKPEGIITVETAVIGHEAVIRIRDTGIGIAPENLNRVYDHFFREDKARSPERGGSGLGLTIAKKIIHGYGGSIQAESIVGQGTTFSIRLPLANPEPQPAPHPPQLPV